MRPALPLTLALMIVAACTSRSSVRSDAATDATSSRASVPIVSPDTARIARILGQLRPPVEAVGRPPVRWTLAERMARYNVPGVSIAVAENGKVAWARGIGVKEAGKPDPVTPTTLFQAASISKPVAATAMLRLVERGTLQLDADVNQSLSSWKVPDNTFTAKEKVTLRRIVSHTAGLTVHGFPGYTTTEPLPTTVQVLNGEKPANTAPVRVDVTPGTISRYSGGGTTVMQQLLVDVTHYTFPRLMQELVLTPAGMTRSTYEQPLPAVRHGEAAHAHDGRGVVVPGGYHVYPEMAPAGLWTTPTDLLHWAIAIADARAGRSHALLSKATAAEMLTEVKGGIALGPFVSGSGRDFQFGHGGANEGFHSQLMMFPERGVGIAIMTNGDGGPMLMRELLLALAAEYELPQPQPMRVNVVSLDARQLAGLTGKYVLRSGPGIPTELREENGSLILSAPQIPTQELLPESETSFVMSTLGWRVTFTRDAAGRATALLVIRPQGPPIEGTRAP